MSAIVRSADRQTDRDGFRVGVGERVLFRERRQPPLRVLGLVLGAILAVAAATGTGSLPLRLATAAVAACVAAAGGVLQRRTWIEDLVVTDLRLVRALRDGRIADTPLTDVVAVSLRGIAVRFRRARGDDFMFPVVRRPRRLQRALGVALPGLTVEREIDLACPT